MLIREKIYLLVFFPFLLTLFPDIEFMNEEAIGYINEEVIGAINEAVMDAIIG